MKKMLSGAQFDVSTAKNKDFRKCLQVWSVSLVYFPFKCLSMSSVG